MDDRSPPARGLTADAARQLMAASVKGRGGGIDGLELIRRLARQVLEAVAEDGVDPARAAGGIVAGAGDGAADTGLDRAAAAAAAAEGLRDAAEELDGDVREAVERAIGSGEP